MSSSGCDSCRLHSCLFCCCCKQKLRFSKEMRKQLYLSASWLKLWHCDLWNEQSKPPYETSLLCLSLQHSLREREGWCWLPSSCPLSPSCWRRWAWSAPPAWQIGQRRRTRWRWLEGLSSSSPVSQTSTSWNQTYSCPIIMTYTLVKHGLACSEYGWGHAKTKYSTLYKKFLSSLFSRSVRSGRIFLVCQQDRTGLLQPPDPH